jgi:hypothetical protein
VVVGLVAVHLFRSASDNGQIVEGIYMTLDDALHATRAEVLRATAKFGPFNSAHEGFAVLLEEVDELWDEVKGNNKSLAREEAIQVAAMAVRFLMDIRP